MRSSGNYCDGQSVEDIPSAFTGVAGNNCSDFVSEFDEINISSKLIDLRTLSCSFHDYQTTAVICTSDREEENLISVEPSHVSAASPNQNSLSSPAPLLQITDCDENNAINQSAYDMPACTKLLHQSAPGTPTCSTVAIQSATNLPKKVAKGSECM